MLNIKQVGFVVIAAALMWSISAVPVKAQYYSQGEVKSSILVDKKIRSIKDKDLMDNIDKATKVFLNGDILEFNIRVENNSDNDMENITAKDFLPANLELIFYPGSFNKANNSIEWTIDKLAKGESKNYQVRARVKGVLADGKRTNVAEASKNKAYDKDQAVYYVGVKTIPVTGSETLIINSIMGLIGVAGAFGLRKYARGY